MPPTELAGIDLNLLVVLRALLAERNVTRAAAKVGLSQSATSHALARLRQLYDDPLLVRSGRTLELTHRASGLGPILERALAELQGTIASPTRFDPETAQRIFRLGTTDYGLTVFVKPLLERLERLAPRIDVHVSGALRPLDTIDDGTIDLAITVGDGIRSGHSSMRLIEDGFVCMLRKGHPALASRFTLRRYLELRHVVVAPAGAPGSIVDNVLAERGLSRRVATRIPSFLAAPLIVAGSDFINTGPRVIAERMADIHPIVLVPAPLKLPRFGMYLVWHKRFDTDPAHTWLRGVIGSLV